MSRAKRETYIKNLMKELKSYPPYKQYMAEKKAEAAVMGTSDIGGPEHTKILAQFLSDREEVKSGDK